MWAKHFVLRQAGQVYPAWADAESRRPVQPPTYANPLSFHELDGEGDHAEDEKEGTPPHHRDKEKCVGFPEHHFFPGLGIDQDLCLSVMKEAPHKPAQRG